MKGVSESKRETVYHFVDRISQMRGPNEDYVTARLSEYVKTREFELAAVEFVKLISRKKFSEAESLMRNALKAGVEKENLGIDYLYDDSTPVARPLLMSLGIKHFDVMRKFHREELVCILGG